MRTVGKRLSVLEQRSSDAHPFVVRTFGGIPPVVPDDIADREVLILQTVIVEPPVRDAGGKIVAPARQWDDDDPRYREIYARMSRPEVAKQ